MNNVTIGRTKPIIMMKGQKFQKQMSEKRATSLVKLKSPPASGIGMSQVLNNHKARVAASAERPPRNIVIPITSAMIDIILDTMCFTFLFSSLIFLPL
jgi:hypothetical protein